MLNVFLFCVCVLSHSYSDDILWFTIFYYSLDVLLNTIWIVWTVFLSYVCSDSYLHVFVDRGLAFWGIIFSCSIWRSCSSLGEWSGFSCEDWRIVQLYKTIQLQKCTQNFELNSRSESQAFHQGILQFPLGIQGSMVSPHGWSEKFIYRGLKYINNIYYMIYMVI